MTLGNYPEIASVELEKLKKKMAELEMELAKARAILKENDLLEKASQVSDCEAICINEIHKLRVASDNGILTLEDVKVLDILHKNLLLAQGRPVDEKKDKKKGAKSVAELLSIVEKK
jgi:glutaredoxin 2